MTPVGHSLVGATIAAACLPLRLSKTTCFLGFTSFIFLANLPDAPLPGWGHHRYYISHSVFVNVAFIAGLLLIGSLWRTGREQLGGWRMLTGGAAAWLSHFLLDTFYNHGRGLAMFWPLSDAHLALPIPWFSTMHPFPPYLNSHSIRVWAVELLVYSVLLGLALTWRYRIGKSK